MPDATQTMESRHCYYCGLHSFCFGADRWVPSMCPGCGAELEPFHTHLTTHAVDALGCRFCEERRAQTRLP